jgi:hypothetical protein
MRCRAGLVAPGSRREGGSLPSRGERVDVAVATAVDQSLVLEVGELLTSHIFGRFELLRRLAHADPGRRSEAAHKSRGVSVDSSTVESRSGPADPKLLRSADPLKCAERALQANAIDQQTQEFAGRGTREQHGDPEL